MTSCMDSRKPLTFNLCISVVPGATEIPAKKDESAASKPAGPSADAATSESPSKGVAFSSPAVSSPPPRGANPSSKTASGAPARRSASPVAAAPPPYDWSSSVRNTIDAKLGEPSLFTSSFPPKPPATQDSTSVATLLLLLMRLAVSIGTLPVRPSPLLTTSSGSPGQSSPDKRRPRDR